MYGNPLSTWNVYSMAVRLQGHRSGKSLENWKLFENCCRNWKLFETIRGAERDGCVERGKDSAFVRSFLRCPAWNNLRARDARENRTAEQKLRGYPVEIGTTTVRGS